MPSPKSKTIRADSSAVATLPKCPTGIQGLDEITLGGVPRGRPTLVCGGPGCGKTLLGMEFLVRGATEFNDPGVCLSFEETAEELSRNVASLGFDLDKLIANKKLAIDYVFVERSLIEEAGEWDLEALFVPRVRRVCLLPQSWVHFSRCWRAGTMRAGATVNGSPSKAPMTFPTANW